MTVPELYDGIGYVLSYPSEKNPALPADPYTGIDLDKCIDPQTGKLEKWAVEVVSTFQSYTELSPSGSGLHIICRGAWPRGILVNGFKRGPVEMYRGGRYLTVTGRCWP